MTRRLVAIALALVIASISLVAWWASASSASDGVDLASGDDSSSTSVERSRAHLEDSPRDTESPRAAVAPRVQAVARAKSPVSDVERVLGRIRVRVEDVHGLPLTGLDGSITVQPLVRDNAVRDLRADARRLPIPYIGELVVDDLELRDWRVVCEAVHFKASEARARLTVESFERDVVLRLDAQRFLAIQLLDAAGGPFLNRLRDAYPGYVSALRAKAVLSATSRASVPPDTSVFSSRRASLVRAGSSSTVFEIDSVRTVDHRDAAVDVWTRIAVDTQEPLTVQLLLGSTLLATTEVPAFAEDVTIVASLDSIRALEASVRVRVVDAASALPLADAIVTASRPFVSPLDVTTDATGVAQLDGLMPPEVELAVRHPLYASQGETVRIEPRATKDATVRLRAGTTLDISVHDARGAPRASFVRVVELGEQANRALPRPTHVDGSRYSRWSANVAPGEYLVYAQGDNVDDAKLGRVSVFEARAGKLPSGSVYVEARRGGASNVVLVVPAKAPK